MKKIALPLLVASACVSLQAVCGISAPLRTLQYGMKGFGSISGYNATGVCSIGVLNLLQYGIEGGNIQATNTATGISALNVVLTGGRINASQIKGKTAYGIQSSGDLSVTLNANYFLFDKYHSSINFESIEATSQAYGVYTPQKLKLKGSGDIVISSILSSGAEAYGISSQDFDITKSDIKINTIQAQSNAYGVKAIDFLAEDASFWFDTISSSTQNAVGFALDSLRAESTSISINLLQAQKGSAVGFYLTDGISYNSYASLGDTGNSFGISQILAEQDAIGIYTPKGSYTNLTTSQYTLRFGSITSNTANAIGWKNGAYSLNIKADNDYIDLGVIEGKSGSYGIYSDKAYVTLELKNSTLAMSLRGTNQKAFYVANQGQIDIRLEDSTLRIDGDGGSVDDLYASGNNYIDLSGRSHNALSNRTSSRTLSIHSLNSHSIMFGSTLSFGLYHAPDKGIADSIVIDNDVGYEGRVNLDIVYEPSSTPTHSQASQYSLLLKADKSIAVKNFSSNSNVGTSVVREGVEDITTLIHRYDKGDISYYYIDNSEKQIHALNSQALLPSLYAMEGMLASYFYTLDSVNKRVGDLRVGYDDSGLWGRMSFGGIDTGSGDVDMSLFQIGGDIQVTKGDKNYLLGLAVGYSPMLSSNEYLSNLSNLDLSIYAGVFFKNGFYYDTQLKLNYLQVETQANQWLGSASFSQWMMNYSNELGYRLSFGGEGGFYLQPSATLNISLLPPISYSQEVINGNPLEVSSEVLMTFQSLVGGKMGYRFGGVERGFDLFLGAYYDFKGFMKGDMKFKTLGSNKEELSSELKGKFRTLGALQFELGSNIEINKHSKLYLDIDFGFGDVLHTTYKLNASYRFTF